MESFEWCSPLASTPIAGYGGANLNEWSRMLGDLRSSGRMAADFYKPHDPDPQRSSEEGNLGVARKAKKNRGAMAAEVGGNCGSDEAELRVAALAVVHNSLLSPRGVFVSSRDRNESGLAYNAGGSSGLPTNSAEAAILRSSPQLSDVLHVADPSMLNVSELLASRQQQPQPQQEGRRQQPCGHGDGDVEKNGTGEFAEVPSGLDLRKLALWEAMDASPLPVLPDQRLRLRAIPMPMPPSHNSVLSTAAASAAAHTTRPFSNSASSAPGSGGGPCRSGGPFPLSPFGHLVSSSAPSGMKVAGSSPAVLPLGQSWSMPAQLGHKVVCQRQQQEQHQQRKWTLEDASGMRSTTDSATIAAVAAVAAPTETGRDEHCTKGRKPRSLKNDEENDDELDWQPRKMRKALWNGRDDGYGSSDGGRAGSCSVGGSGHRIKAKSMMERQRRDRISEALTRLRVAVDGHGDTASMLNHAVHTLRTLQQTNKKMELQLLQHKLLCSCDATNAPLHCHRL